MAGNLYTLAGICQCKGDYHAAQEHLREDLQIQRSLYGDASHHNLVLALCLLCQVYLKIKHPTKALSHLEEAMQEHSACGGINSGFRGEDCRQILACLRLVGHEF